MKGYIAKYKKYRGILLSVALFLLLDASVLSLNFYMSFEISEDAVGVNLAGRQRMLSQRMTKSLFIMKASEINSGAYSSAYQELINSKNTFDNTFNAFLIGGSTMNADGESVVLKTVTDQRAISALESAKTYWLPYKAAIENVIAQRNNRSGADEQALNSALQIASSNNLPLLGLMNDLTVTLEQVASSKATRLRLIQTIGIALAVLNFLFIMMHFLRQLRSSDEVIEKARQETTEILDTVNEGLFLLDHNYVIGDQYSKVLLQLFETPDIAGRPLEELLDSIGITNDHETAKEFISLLFDKKVKQNLIQDLNPLDRVEANLNHGDNKFTTKYLNFSFSRVLLANGEISHILVTVQDITDKVNLERALQSAKEHNEQQVLMMTSLLHIQPDDQRQFIRNAYRYYEEVNEILKRPAKNQSSLQEKASKIFRQMHSFKGEASALQLDIFENKAHAIEDIIARLQRLNKLHGDDFLPIAVQLNELIDYTHQLEEMIGKLSALGASYKIDNTISIPTTPDNTLCDYFSRYVKDVAERNNKEVMLSTIGLEHVIMSNEEQQQFKALCLQLLKNAVIHGIESPEQRTQSHKPPMGHIHLRVTPEQGTIRVNIIDDGRGLDYDAIRARAKKMDQWPSSEIDHWSKEQLATFIFKEGVSTANSLTIDAGRGVGMGSVVQYIAAKRGKITVSSRTGQHCQFSISLPLNTRHSQAA